MEQIHGEQQRSPSPLKGCFSSLATRTQAVVAKSGHTKLRLMADVGASGKGCRGWEEDKTGALRRPSDLDRRKTAE